MRHSGLRTRGRSIIATLACSAMVAGILVGAASPAGAAQSVALVRDINPGAANSSPTSYTAFGGTTLFVATTAANGAELWKTDGTTAGTVLVKDINPGTGGSSIGAFTNFNGQLFFVANDGVNGSELWTTNGTEAGTVMFKDINPAAGNAAPAALTVIGSTLYFSANDGTTGAELWTSDGTPGGTALVKDINTFTVGGSSSPASFFLFGSNVFFTATDGTTGAELFKTDGTGAGTLLLKDIRAGLTGSSIANMNNVNGTFLFTANDNVAGTELWTSDGTPGGTVLFKDINPTANTASNPSQFINFNGTWYFTATNGATANGNEIWKTDGTVAGTTMFIDLNPGTGNSGVGPFRILNGELLFQGFTPAAGSEIMKSDGTVAGTVVVGEVVPGTTGGTIQNLGLPTTTNLVYFMAVATGTGQELWRTDGTAAGTFMTKDIVPGSGNGILVNFSNAELNGILYFTGGGFDREVWRTDGTTAGTFIVQDLVPGTTGSFPTGMVVVNGILFFQNSVTATGTELYRINTGPTAVNDGPYTTAEDTPLSVSAPGLLANDADADNFNGLTAVKVTDPLHGSVTVNGDGSFSYVPVANYNGPDSFTYKANDGSVDSSPPTTVSITVSAAADAPVAGDDNYSTNQNTSLTIAAPGVLGNDTDGDGDALTAGSASTPANGAVAFNANGSFTYTPNGSFVGTDSFTYVVSDGLGGTDTGTVNITVSVPAISASPSTVTAGDSVTATWSGVGNPSATDWVGLYASATDPDAALLAWDDTGGSAAGSVNLTVPLSAGAGSTYELRLFANNTYTRLATSAPFTVAASATTVAASPATVTAGTPVTATWSGIAAPTATDWVGLYPDASTPDAGLLAWAYTGGAAGGALNLTVPAGSTPGSAYELRLFTNNTYTRIATSAPFTVAASATAVSASPPSVNAGDPVTATWSGIASPTATDWVGLYASGADPDPAIAAWAFTGGGAAGSLNLVVPVGSPSGATYELRLFSNNTYTRLATSGSFSVVASAAAISASPASVANGSPVTATWSGIGTPNATDWVGLYAASGDPDPAIVAWAYTGGTAAGSLNLTVPLGSPPGATYELRLYANNTYTRLATSAPFTVT